MSRRRLGPNSGAGASGGLRCPHGRRHRRAVDDDAARASVIADRNPAPVRQQRLGVRPKEPPEIRRVLDRRVEIDVVADLHRHAHLHVVRGRPRSARRRLRATADRRRRAAAAKDARAAVSHDRASGGEERIEQRLPASSSGSQQSSKRPARATAQQSRICSPIATPMRGALPSRTKTPKGRF